MLTNFLALRKQSMLSDLSDCIMELAFPRNTIVFQTKNGDQNKLEVEEYWGVVLEYDKMIFSSDSVFTTTA